LHHHPALSCQGPPGSIVDNVSFADSSAKHDSCNKSVRPEDINRQAEPYAANCVSTLHSAFVYNLVDEHPVPAGMSMSTLFKGMDNNFSRLVKQVQPWLIQRADELNWMDPDVSRGVAHPFKLPSPCRVHILLALHEFCRPT
jgi:hypothetical protein